MRMPRRRVLKGSTRRVRSEARHGLCPFKRHGRCELLCRPCRLWFFPASCPLVAGNVQIMERSA